MKTDNKTALSPRIPTARLLLAAGVALATASPAAATLVDIINVTGANDGVITTNPPNPIVANPNDGILLAWDEKQNVTLSQKLYVDRVFDNTASFIGSDAGGTYIDVGTVVSSHYLQWDPGSGSSSSVQATIQLDSQAFAFITADQKLFNSDPIVGLDGFDYADFGLRGLEPGDTTDFNGPDVDIDWSAGSPGDWTRLITAFSPTAAPELTTNNNPLNPATVDFGLTRVGTTSAADLTLTNDGGDQPDGLTGSVAAVPLAAPFSVQGGDPTFGPLAEDASTTKTFAFAPLTRSPSSFTNAIITSNDTEDTADADATVTLTGQGVGPDAGFTFDGNPLANGGDLAFGDIIATETATLILTIANNSNDPNAGDDTLTDLTVNDIRIENDGAGVYSFAGITPGTVIGKGQSVQVEVTFDPMGDTCLFYMTQLIVETDQGAALGGDGADYSFELSGTGIVPEPTSLALLSLGGLLVARRRG